MDPHRGKAIPRENLAIGLGVDTREDGLQERVGRATCAMLTMISYCPSNLGASNGAFTEYQAILRCKAMCFLCKVFPG